MILQRPFVTPDPSLSDVFCCDQNKVESGVRILARARDDVSCQAESNESIHDWTRMMVREKRATKCTSIVIRRSWRCGMCFMVIIKLFLRMRGNKFAYGLAKNNRHGKWREVSSRPSYHSLLLTLV